VAINYKSHFIYYSKRILVGLYTRIFFYKWTRRTI